MQTIIGESDTLKLNIENDDTYQSNSYSYFTVSVPVSVGGEYEGTYVSGLWASSSMTISGVGVSGSTSATKAQYPTSGDGQTCSNTINLVISSIPAGFDDKIDISGTCSIGLGAPASPSPE